MEEVYDSMIRFGNDVEELESAQRTCCLCN